MLVVLSLRYYSSDNVLALSMIMINFVAQFQCETAGQITLLSKTLMFKIKDECECKRIYRRKDKI